MNPEDYKGKNVLVLGLGISGGAVGVVKFLVKQGAVVTVTDQKSKRELREALEELQGVKVKKYFFGKTSLSLLKDVDLLIVNPAVDLRSPFIVAAKKEKIPMNTELGVFIQHCPGKIVAITGSKGKSTVTQLIYNILSLAGKKVVLGGNIGTSLLHQLKGIDAYTYVVLEVSSFQLDLFKLAKIEFQPSVAVLTNIFKEHLDRYSGFSAYI